MVGNKTCGCCDTSKSFNQFYKSPLEGEKTYLHICKTCCRKKINNYLKITNHESSTIWLMLAELGVPFLKEVWEQVEKMIVVGKNKPDLILHYLNYLNEMGIITHGFWESDTMLDMLMKTNVDRNQKHLDLMEQQKIWGKFIIGNNIDEEAYEILNRAFEKYTKDLEIPDENYEERIRDLCRCELRLRKANEARDGSEISKAQDSLNKQLSMLKMNEFQSRMVSDEKRAFEHKISIIENYRPAECEELEDYLDKVGYEKEKAILMRSIRNAIAETREYPNIPAEYRDNA